ncbi:MAG TPA: hypothetical protein VMS31_11185 [Pyrinomonadaceae bacterium]|nr:hypothetical protein [Pyrinomonadaceae bacterium]
MKAGHLILSNSSMVGQNSLPKHAGGLVGKIGGGLNRLFGCWHSEMSRPFSSDGQTYKVCLGCGARRQFNIRSWELQGGFYYGPARSTNFGLANGLAVR